MRKHHKLFEGNGEMASLMQQFNWDEHPLGNPSGWAESLKTTIRLMLHSSFPMFLWWTEELYMFHNDAYLPALGKKHPHVLGRPAWEGWSELWFQIEGIVKEVVNGKPFYAKNLLLFLNRKGFMEETYWTFSYSPAPGEGGKIMGVFCACNETTNMVVGQRRLKTIKDITDAAVVTQSLTKAVSEIGSIFNENRIDIPFSLFYLFDENNKEAVLSAGSGDFPLDPTLQKIELNNPDSEDIWGFGSVLDTRSKNSLLLPDKYNFTLKAEVHEGLVKEVMVYPVTTPGEDSIIGFLVLALSPFISYDEDYENFHSLLVSQIATSLSSVQAREETIAQQQELKSLFEQAPVAFSILDGKDYIIQLANPKICELWGRKWEDVINKPVLLALPEVKSQGVEKLLDDVYIHGITHSFSSYEINLVRNNKPEKVYVNFIYYPFRNRGQITGILVIASEVTDQVIAQKEIEQKNKELVTINADLDNFVYAASHDLKGPIINIEGLMKVLIPKLPKEIVHKPDVDKVLQMISRSISRLQTTISDLSEVSRVQKEQVEDQQKINVSEMVADVLSDIELLVQTSGATIINESNSSFIHFSPKNFRSIVYNLISNALKYQSPDRKPEIRLSHGERNDEFFFTVSDNGLGFDQSQEEKVFSMFKRLHSHVEGSGIGLYIVKRIVENANGRIEVESEINKGSTFTIFLKK